MKNTTKRIEFLDELRGFAIIAMVIHHTFLDIGEVYAADWGYEVFYKLCSVQPLFWAIFIIVSGICTGLSRNPVKRGIIVFGCAMVVTLATTVIMHIFGFYGAEIYFGILHFMGCSMIITGLLMPVIKKIPVFSGMIACVILFAATYNISSGNLLFGLIELPTIKTNLLMPLGLYNSDFASADYFAIFPWIFMFLFGSFLGRYAKAGAFPQWTYKKRCVFLGFVGKNSLWVYMGHQVVIYAVLYLILGICLLKEIIFA